MTARLLSCIVASVCVVAVVKPLIAQRERTKASSGENHRTLETLVSHLGWHGVPVLQ